MPNRVTDLARRDIAPDVPIAAAVNVLQAAAGRADPEALCASVGLTAARLAEPDARMPYRQLAALYEHAARHTGDRWFGLRVGAGIDLRSFGLTGYLALSSPTLADALASLARYLPLWTDGAALQLDRARAGFELSWRYTDPVSAADARHDCEMTLAACANVGGLLGAGAWRPRELRFRHPRPADPSLHTQLLRAPARFAADHDLLCIDGEAAALRLRSADARLHGWLRELADDQLTSRARERTVVDDAALVIGRLLPDGGLRIDRVARALGLGPRTLQRRLIACGTTFRALVDAVRRDHALRALDDDELTIGALAARLGYRAPAELHRAFRAWVGVGPAAYRRARSGRGA